MFGVTERTVMRIVERGELSCVKIGGVIRFRPEDVEEYVNRPYKPRTKEEK